MTSRKIRKPAKRPTPKAKSSKVVKESTPLYKAGLAWRFLERRSYDPRSYGNAARYATPQTIESLVRETGQNSLDAAAEGRIAMRFRLVELPAGSHRREKFMKALNFVGELRPHLQAVADGKRSQTASRIKSALADLDNEQRPLFLLAVEDYSAKGLGGDELDADGNFCALIRDSENSRKGDDTAGGSFGLGSKTLWSCSNLLTVLFSSKLADKEELRFIGKADLGYHSYPGGAAHGYQGQGLFGDLLDQDGSESRWEKEKSPLLSSLCLTRLVPEGFSDSGTSALIVAFDDPESDDETAAEIIEKLKEHVARNFWPAMVRDQMKAWVSYECGDDLAKSIEYEVHAADYVPSLVDAYWKFLRDETTDSLKVSGDVVSVPITHMIPATRPEADVKDHHSEHEAEARLIIRLADSNAKDDDLRDSVALARGRAMVTQYLPKKNLSLGARPFHAFLAAGHLAGSGTAQTHAEVFLRFAEPPAHDRWEMWGGLKSRYQRGAGTHLKALLERVTERLRQYVSGSVESRNELPDVLRELLTLTQTALPNEQGWKLTPDCVSIENGHVDFTAQITLKQSSDFEFVPVVQLVTESGGYLDLKLQAGSVSATGGVVANEVVSCTAQKAVRFSGRAEGPSLKLDLQKYAVRLTAHLKMTANKATE